MKVFVIPDVHLKPWILKKADVLIEKGEYDKIVFLGDFVDDWGQERNIGLYDDTFNALRDFLKKHTNSLVCYGNHDISYVWGRLESGYSAMAKSTVLARLQEIRSILRADQIGFLFRIDQVLFSHAGLTRSFVMKHFAYDTDTSVDHIVECVNHMTERELWKDDSPIWARPQYGNAAMYPAGFLQVVGHTPVEKVEKAGDLLSLDNFSTYRNGDSIGDVRFVWVDTETKEYYYAE